MDKNDKLLAKWLNGELQGQELQDFVNECRENPELMQIASDNREMERMLENLNFDPEKSHKEIMLKLEGDIPDTSQKVISILERRQTRKR